MDSTYADLRRPSTQRSSRNIMLVVRRRSTTSSNQHLQIREDFAGDLEVEGK